MGNEHSRPLSTFGTEFVLSSASYGYMFWRLFNYFQKIKGKNPQNSLLIATNTISIIHCIISSVPSLVDFFYYKRWEKTTIDEPKLAGHIWAISVGYFVSDMLAHLICFALYNPKIIKRKWDIILHHIIPCLWWFIIQFPKPIYGWSFFSILPSAEVSTIFLNLQWLGKHFNFKTLQKLSHKLFLVSWMQIRVPVVIYAIYWFIKYWKKINKDFPFSSVVCLTSGLIPMATMQIVWTYLLISKKIFKHGKKPLTFEGVSFN